MKIQDVVAGNYYYAEYDYKSRKNVDSAIVKVMQNGSFKNCPGVRIDTDIFLKNNPEWDISRNIRKADESEIAWLDDCIAAGTYVKKKSMYCFKPSTKEAYEAQNQPKAVKKLDNLEEWLLDTKSKNLSLDELSSLINECNFDNIYSKLKGCSSNEKAKILFDEWNPKAQSIEEILEICKKKYPIGTKVKSLGGYNITISEHYPLRLGRSSTQKMNVFTDDGFAIYNEQYEPKWAEIIELPKTVLNNSADYKVGDYVVIINTSDQVLNPSIMNSVVKIDKVDRLGYCTFEKMNNELIGLKYAREGGVWFRNIRKATWMEEQQYKAQQNIVSESWGVVNIHRGVADRIQEYDIIFPKNLKSQEKSKDDLEFQTPVVLKSKKIKNKLIILNQ